MNALWEILDFLLSSLTSEAKGWLGYVSLGVVLVGVLGVIGVAGLILIDLEIVRVQSGPIGEALIYREVLIAVPFVWALLVGLGTIYWRLHDSSIGKPDAED